MREHEQSDKHRRKVETVKNENLNESLERKFQQINLSDTKKNNPSLSVKKEPSQDEAGDLYCKICEKPFTGEQSRMEHMRSEKHRRKVETLNNCAKLVKVSATSADANRSANRCEVCQKSFSGEKSMEEHLRSEKHLKKVSQARLGFVPALECKPCKKEFSGQESLEEHLKSKKHLNMVK